MSNLRDKMPTDELCQKKWISDLPKPNSVVYLSCIVKWIKNKLWCVSNNINSQVQFVCLLIQRWMKKTDFRLPVLTAWITLSFEKLESQRPKCAKMAVVALAQGKIHPIPNMMNHGESASPLFQWDVFNFSSFWACCSCQVLCEMFGAWKTAWLGISAVRGLSDRLKIDCKCLERGYLRQLKRPITKNIHGNTVSVLQTFQTLRQVLYRLFHTVRTTFGPDA